MAKPQSVEILVATSAGVCFGVERALNLSEKALADKKTGPISSLGPLIHNPQAVSQLSEKGLKVAENVADVSGTIVFRSHGVTTQVQEEAKIKGLNVIDATCPLVKVPQNFAKKLSEAGYFVVIVGDKDHPEIRGVRSYVQNDQAVVVKSAEEIEGLADHEKVGIICQTTLKKKILTEVVEACQKKFKVVKVHNTICGATKDRQEAALELAEQVECVVIIGGKNSSNTQKLFDICFEVTHDAHLVETENELRGDWFLGKKKIGITAGASTPHAAIERVRERILALVAAS